MSRMVAYVAPSPIALDEAMGEASLSRFVRLSVLHSDGWGIAGRDSRGLSGTRGLSDAATALPRAGIVARASGLAYLRFASRGSAVSAENLQPFVHDGLVFAHNGALSPRANAFDVLSEPERNSLRGTTDSEVYFAHVRRELAGSAGRPEVAVARAAARMRAMYPAACLNAMMLVDEELFVVHSPGTVPAPHDAFASRGWEMRDLPPGHDDGYNDLSWTVGPSGAVVVATSGCLPADAAVLPKDRVLTVTAAGITGQVPIRA